MQFNPDGFTARIPLKRRDGVTVAYAIVDSADANWLNQWHWHRNKAGYAVRGEWNHGNPISIKMHREVLGLTRESEVLVDHIDRDRLNNTRGNLRATTPAGNAQNVTVRAGATSAHRGVAYRPDTGRWRAYVRVHGKLIHLGSFDSEMDAARTAKAARARLLPFATD